ncbi:MAG: alpha/beta hydrolase [Leeuwenhoekiella sp.]
MILAYRGSQIFYTDKGSGPVTILLHGFLENHKMWNDITVGLEKNNRFIAVDLPGHGNSSVLSGENTMKAIAEALYFLLIKLGVDKVNLAGHSMGGYVALAFAKAYPLKTKGVFLFNSTPEADTAERKKLRKHGAEVAKKNYEALISMSVANLFSQKSRQRFAEAIEYTKEEALKTPLEGYIAGQLGMMQREDLSSFWADGKFKRAMLLGSDDTLLNAQRLKNLFSVTGVKIIIVDGGHMSQIENIVECKNSFSDFLSY